jgi:hypothetical protein
MAATLPVGRFFFRSSLVFRLFVLMFSLGLLRTAQSQDPRFHQYLQPSCRFSYLRVTTKRTWPVSRPEECVEKALAVQSRCLEGSFLGVLQVRLVQANVRERDRFDLKVLGNDDFGIRYGSSAGEAMGHLPHHWMAAEKIAMRRQTMGNRSTALIPR